MVLPRSVPVPRNAFFRDGYWLVRREAPLRIPFNAAGDFFVVDWDVFLKLTPSSAKRLGREFAEQPLMPKPEKNEQTGRWDLRLDLSTGNKCFHMHFHRLVGLCLKQTNQDALGRKLQRPMYVKAENWELYEVNHRNWNNLDCRLYNLVPEHARRHRGEGRRGWHKMCLTLKDKVKQLRNPVRKMHVQLSHIACGRTTF